MGIFDFFGTSGAATPPVATPPVTDPNAGVGFSDWISKNPTQFAALMGTGAKAIDPQGLTTGGQVGSAISGIAQSKIMADKAAQDAIDRKALMAKLGLTPQGQPGPTSFAAKVGPTGEVTTTTTETPMTKPKQYDLPSVFGPGGASNFP